jgi:hypothetical protein
MESPVWSALHLRLGQRCSTHVHGLGRLSCARQPLPPASHPPSCPASAVWFRRWRERWRHRRRHEGWRREWQRRERLRECRRRPAHRRWPAHRRRPAHRREHAVRREGTLPLGRRIQRSAYTIKLSNFRQSRRPEIVVRSMEAFNALDEASAREL